MKEKVLIAIATYLFEKLGEWLTRWYTEERRQGRDHDRIGETVQDLINARTEVDIRDAFSRLD